jgi:hypothetical protein
MIHRAGESVGAVRAHERGHHDTASQHPCDIVALSIPQAASVMIRVLVPESVLELRLSVCVATLRVVRLPLRVPSQASPSC